MKDEKAKYLILDCLEIQKQTYKCRREFAFNDWSNIYIPDKIINANEIFDKNNIPKEYRKIIIKINIPFCLKKEAEEYTMGFLFDITAGKLEEVNNKKTITVSSYPIYDYYANQEFRDKIKFRTEFVYYNFEDIMKFLQELEDKGYLKIYLQSIKEFFDISINLDLLFNSWKESSKNPKKTLRMYKKKINSYMKN